MHVLNQMESKDPPIRNLKYQEKHDSIVEMDPAIYAIFKGAKLSSGRCYHFMRKIYNFTKNTKF